MNRQTTINEAVRFSGIGLHSGCRVSMEIQPAPEESGIVFCRTDLDGFPIPARADLIANVSYATTLMRKGVLVSTVEHVLSALYGLGVDNARILIDNLEVPIMDGSALPFTEAIRNVGLKRQSAPRRMLKIRRPVHHTLGDKTISAEPGDSLEVAYGIDFQHPLIGRQEASYRIDPEDYHRHLAPCRTFGFLRDISHLKENGLIQGGSLDNAVVLSDDGVVNPEGLRFPDEFIRHKVMDFVGDISLLGMPVVGRFRAYKAGHGIHAAIVHKILADPANFSIVEVDTADATGVA